MAATSTRSQPSGSHGPRDDGPAAATATARTGSEQAAESGLETPQAPATRQQPRLNRETFTSSRLLEFCSQRELIAQTGHEVADKALAPDEADDHVDEERAP